MIRSVRSFRLLMLALLAAFALLVVACEQTTAPGGGGTPPPDEEPVDEPGEPTDPEDPTGPEEPERPPGDPSADHACERLAYPCTFAETPLERLERSDEVLGEIHARHLEGASFQAIAEWLESEPDMAEVSIGPHAIRYRVEGSPPMWFERSLVQLEVPAETPNRHGGLPVPDKVVGEDTNGDGKMNQRDPKRALVLRPFEWYFNGYAEAVAGESVSSTSDVMASFEGDDSPYRGNVEILRNEQVTLDAFRDWSSYDAISLGTHGSYTCETGPGDPCYTKLGTGILVDDCAAAIQRYGDRGLTCGGMTLEAVRSPEPGETAVQEIAYVQYLSVTAEFLRDNGAADVEAIVFFNACQVFAGFDLPMAFGLNRGVYVGWTDTVSGDVAASAEARFWELMVDLGAKTETTMRWLGKDGLNRDERTGARLQRVGMGLAGSDLRSQQAAEDLRAREIVTLLDYAGNRVVDDTNLIFDLVGAPDDGRDDKLDLGVLVDGVEPGTQGQYSVRFELNGERVGREVSLGDGSQVGEFSYRLNIEDLPLGTDVEETFEGSSFTFYLLEAIVALPDGGESRYEAKVVFEGTYWSMTVASTPRAGRYGGNCGSFIREYVNPEGPDLGFFLGLGQVGVDGSNETTASVGFEVSVPRNTTGTFSDGVVQVYFTPVSDTYSAYVGAGTMTIAYNRDRMLRGTVSGLLETVASMNPPRTETTAVEIAFTVFEVDTVQQMAERCANANGAGG